MTSMLKKLQVTKVIYLVSFFIRNGHIKLKLNNFIKTLVRCSSKKIFLKYFYNASKIYEVNKMFNNDIYSFKISNNVFISHRVGLVKAVRQRSLPRPLDLFLTEMYEVFINNLILSYYKIFQP